MLSWEGSPIQGAPAITEKLTVRDWSFTHEFKLELISNNIQSLPFAKVQHKVSTMDAQPSSTSIASLLVSVTGLLVVRVTSLRYFYSVYLTSPLHFAHTSLSFFM
jgi:hypothetical protein